MTDDEKDRALCEAHCNTAADEYFNARPQLDSDANRRIFYAGHRKAWIERGESVRLNAQAVPEPAYVELPDDIRVPLDSVSADAGYLIGRLLLGTMSAAQVIRVIQDRIEVAKAATRTALSVAPAAPQPAQPLTDEQRKFLRFLGGYGEWDGVWFGDPHPTKAVAYWWRKDMHDVFHGIGVKP